MHAHEMSIRPEIAPAVLGVLVQDRASAQLIDAIRSGAPIDLAAPRTAEEAAHDGQAPTIAGYLLGLIRDRFITGLADYREFVALGSLAGDIEAAQA